MAAWLDIISEGGDWTLVDTNRLGELVNGMPFPRRQYPDLVYFAGNKSRIRALRSFLPQNNVTRKGPSGLIRLHVNHRAINTDSPLMIAESSLCLQQSTGDTKWLRYATTKHRKHAIYNAEVSSPFGVLQEEIKRQLVLPWTRVLCLFVGSTSDLEAAKSLLQRPHRQLQVGNQAVRSSPQVIIVLNNSIEGQDIASPRYDGLRQIAEKGRTTFLDLRSRSGLSDMIVFEPLRLLISEKLQIVHAEDERVCGKFSAFHMISLWEASVPVVGQIWKASPLDLLAQARTRLHDTENMDKFLHDFFQSVKCSINHSAILEGLVEVVASAFLMNAYPPGMHGRADSPELDTNANDIRIPSLDRFYHIIRGVLYRYLGQISFRKSHQTHPVTICRKVRRIGGQQDILIYSKRCTRSILSSRRKPILNYHLPCLLVSASRAYVVM